VKKIITIFSVIAFAYANAEVVKDEAYYIKKHIITDIPHLILSKNNIFKIP
jgi:hypothetical protein